MYSVSTNSSIYGLKGSSTHLFALFALAMGFSVNERIAPPE
jgi:hypothetical protein